MSGKKSNIEYEDLFSNWL